MRAILFALTLVCLSSTVAAQDALPTEIEAIHTKYGGFEFAVMMMDRDEWEVYRSWEGYDQEAVIAVIKRHQEHARIPRAQGAPQAAAHDALRQL